MNEPVKPPRRQTLFARIVVSFVGGVLLFMSAAALLAFVFARGGASWVAEVTEVIDTHNEELLDKLGGPPPPADAPPGAHRGPGVRGHDGPPGPPDFDALDTPHNQARQGKRAKQQAKTRMGNELRERMDKAALDLSEELGAEVRIIPAHGLRAMRRKGLPMPPGLQLSQKQRKALHRGSPVVLEKGFGPPKIVWRIYDHERGRIAAFVIVQRSSAPPFAIAGGIALLLLSLLAVAWPLARSLTGRLRELEVSTQAFAAGDLDARARVDARSDEVDQLASSFNDMATRISQLITGQRTLLANVSHELRTPLARMRVLLELLGERAARAPYGEDPGAARVRQGLEELDEDVNEMNQLVGDLLTSGRLELGRELEPRPVEFAEIGPRVAAKFSAHYTGEESPGLQGDPLLLERVLSNLLANAKRACPHGRVEVGLERAEQSWVLSVQDEGDGVPPERREEIFEAFTRLDSARSRDAGGVGLGLHLSRQVAKAHGGSLRCVDRPDGKSGARFELDLPDAALAN